MGVPEGTWGKSNIWNMSSTHSSKTDNQNGVVKEMNSGVGSIKNSVMSNTNIALK